MHTYAVRSRVVCLFLNSIHSLVDQTMRDVGISDNEQMRNVGISENSESVLVMNRLFFSTVPFLNGKHSKLSLSLNVNKRKFSVLFT